MSHRGNGMSLIISPNLDKYNREFNICVTQQWQYARPCDGYMPSNPPSVTHSHKSAVTIHMAQICFHFAWEAYHEINILWVYNVLV